MNTNDNLFWIMFLILIFSHIYLYLEIVNNNIFLRYSKFLSVCKDLKIIIWKMWYVKTSIMLVVVRALSLIGRGSDWHCQGVSGSPCLYENTKYFSHEYGSPLTNGFLYVKCVWSQVVSVSSLKKCSMKYLMPYLALRLCLSPESKWVYNTNSRK